MSAALGPEWDEHAIGWAITPIRLQSYRSAARGDLHAALRLYDWNAVASAAVLMTVAMVEVITRNAMDSRLTAWATRRGERSWFDAIPLDGKAFAALDHAFGRSRPGRVGTTSTGRSSPNSASGSGGCWWLGGT